MLASNDSSTWSNTKKPHTGNDPRWEAIRKVTARDGALQPRHFRALQGLGRGDIGSVYRSELRGTATDFAVKVMDKAVLAGRRQSARAETEREILRRLDHPFLPTLYAHLETDDLSCLVTEFCPGGDLLSLRKRQPAKRFSEEAARFYVAEVLLALEYLHMLGIVHRDLKPENVLVRGDGHIMLTDFDLSLRACAASPPTMVSSPRSNGKSSCIRFLDGKKRRVVPELIAEPKSVWSRSVVGTHEYLAPEIVRGEGHGSAVDWWTLGILLYELVFGRTPFKGSADAATLFNVVGEALTFPREPTVSDAAKDLMRRLLAKDPQQRLGYRRGATEVKQHPFFHCIKWSLIRCTQPPEVPRPFH